MRILTFPEFLENTVSISLANPNPPLKSNFFPEYNLSISSCKFAERACSLRKYECEPGQHESISVSIKEVNHFGGFQDWVHLKGGELRVSSRGSGLLPFHRFVFEIWYWPA
jgi:hypothetical protein